MQVLENVVWMQKYMCWNDGKNFTNALLTSYLDRLVVFENLGLRPIAINANTY